MISNSSSSSQDYRLHADAFLLRRSLRDHDSCMSTDSRLTISEKSDAKKCAFECWLPDNSNYYYQTAVKFRSATRVISGPTLSDVKWKRNIVQTNNLTSHAQSISQVTRSTVGGQPSIHTRFSVHSRSYNSRPWKDISSRLPSSSTSSYCSMVVTRDLQKYTCKANKPGRRFSLFRTTSRRGIARLKPAGDVWASSDLPSDCSQQLAAAVKCAELQCSLHNGEGGGCGPAGVGGNLLVYHKKAVNTNIKEAAIAHLMTESLQTGDDVGSKEEEAMKTEHTAGGKHSDAERFWNKLWNNIPTSGAEENLSVVKLRQMAGKLIESLICKIRLQLDADIHPSTGELECATNENEANKHVESQHCNRTGEERVPRGRGEVGGGGEVGRGQRHKTDDHRHLKEDDYDAAAAAGEGKHRRRHQASEEQEEDDDDEEEELRLLARAQGPEGAVSQQKIFVNQDDNMQPVIIHRPADRNDYARDQRHGSQNPSELSAKCAARGSDRGAFPLQPVRRFDAEADRRRESKRLIEENRGAHNDKSSLTSSMDTASSDYDVSSSFNEEGGGGGGEEVEMGRSDISLETRRFRGLVDVISYMILQRQQMSVQRSDELTNNSNNDDIKKTEAVKYRSSDHRPTSDSDRSSSSSVEEETEEKEDEEESSGSSTGEFGSRLEVPGSSSANIREPKSLSEVQSESSSAKKESETTSTAPSSSSTKDSEATSSAPSSSSSAKKKSETASSAPSSSSSIKKKSETMSSAQSVPNSTSPMKKESETTSSVPNSSSSIKKKSDTTSSAQSVPNSTSPMKKGSETASSVPSSSSSIRKESEKMSSVPNSSSSVKKGSEIALLAKNPSSSKRKGAERMPSAPSSSSPVKKDSEPKLEVIYNSWEANPSAKKNARSRKGVVAATSSHSILSSTMHEEGFDGTTEHATMSAEAEATLKRFATEVVQSLYAAIRFKLKNLVDDIKDEAKRKEILQRGDIELRSQILPTIIEHIVWIIKEEFRGQDEAKWKEAMMQDPGQYLDTIVTNAVMKTHADHRMRKRSFLKTFVVTSNFRQSSK